MAESAQAAAGSFLEELKHRKVYQTTVTYGVAVFVVWQIADVSFEPLGLPPSFMRFVILAALLGFPVAIGLSWVLEVVPQRPREAPDPVAAPDRSGPPDADPAEGRPAPARRRLRPLLLALIALTGVLGLGLLGWTVVPHQRAGLEAGESVLLARLQNETGDPRFEGTLEESLRLALSQSPHLNLVAPARIQAGLRRMRLPPDTPLDEEVAVEMALREGVTAVVAPSIRRIGGTFLVGARVLAPGTGEALVARTTRAEGERGVLPAVDELARQLRSDLGESLASLVRRRIRLDVATTASLDALHAWTQANEMAGSGRAAEAGTLYRRAVEIDSAFALAHADLAQWYYWHMGDPATGDRHFDAALRHADGVTERERLMIEGKAAEWRGNREGAIAAYRAVTALLPHDRHAWGNLAYQYLRLGRHDEAATTYERVLELDPYDATALVNLATVRAAQGRLEDAVPLYERAFELQPGYRTLAGINEEFGQALVAMGRFEEAETLFEEMFATGPGGRARGLRSLGLLLSRRGRIREAAERFREAAVLQEAGGIPVSELRDRCFLASALLRLGREGEARTQLRVAHDLALEHPISTDFVATAGVLLARAADLDGARRLLEVARERSNDGLVDRRSVRHLEGEIALAAGDPAGAVAALSEARTLATSETPVRLDFSLARAHLAADDRASAGTALQRVVQAGAGRAVREALEEWIVAHLLLARLRAEQGDTEASRTLYARFLELQGDGDPGLEGVAEARAAVEGG